MRPETETDIQARVKLVPAGHSEFSVHLTPAQPRPDEDERRKSRVVEVGTSQIAPGHSVLLTR